LKIFLLDGHPEANQEGYDSYLRALVNSLTSKNHVIKKSSIREQTIKFCTGCWSCWLKTPGECIFKDDSQAICRDYLNADFVLFASPIIMGFTSALLKKAQDKMIPLVHPYIEFVQGECHHKKRYPHYPKVGLLLHKSENADEEDIQIITTIFQRFVLNLRSEYCFTTTTDQAVEEVCDAINAL